MGWDGMECGVKWVEWNGSAQWNGMEWDAGWNGMEWALTPLTKKKIHPAPCRRAICTTCKEVHLSVLFAQDSFELVFVSNRVQLSPVRSEDAAYI